MSPPDLFKEETTKPKDHLLNFQKLEKYSSLISATYKEELISNSLNLIS